jgi:hypothetical protein
MAAMLAGLNTFADRIDRVTTAIGRTVAWLALVVVVLQFALVVARYLFGLGSIWLTEAVIYGHATLLMLAAAWTLKAGGHVRVDIFYADASPRTQALCRTVLGGAGAFAGSQRPAAGVRAQDSDPAVRCVAGAARRRAGDPRVARALSRPSPEGEG